MRSIRSALLLFATFLFTATPSEASERAPLSSLPVLRASKERTEATGEYGVPGLAVKEQTSGTRSYLEVHALTGRGYCLASRNGTLNLAGSSSYWSERDDDELWRLTEKDGTATFERTRFTVVTSVPSVPSVKDAWLTSKTSVELRKVTTERGVTVWGFRDDRGNVVLLARGAVSGRELRPNKEEGDPFEFVSSSECPFGAVRLSTSLGKSGAIAQLRGAMPPVGEGKSKVIPQFIVDGSFAKLTRDPEPMVSIRVRLLD